MVDVTYQMVLSTLQTVGLLVGIIYYIMTLQNTRKNQQMQLETRQTQLFRDFYKLDESAEFGQIVMEMIYEWEFDDYDDYVKNFSPISGNLETYSKGVSVFIHYDGLGVQAKKGRLDLDDVYDLYSTRLIPLWEKWAATIYEARRRGNAPQVYEHIEWVYNELKKIEAERGHGFSVDTVFKLENEEKLKP